MVESGTITILFTDLVGSTALASRLGEEATDELRRVHFGLLARAAAATTGEVIKNLGDGLMVAFRSAADGVAGAVAMQQAIDRHNQQGGEPLEMRIGVALGDAVREDGEWFGTPAVEAARLCAKANGGQILCTEVVRVLAGTRGGHRFASVGSLELKGVPESVPTSQVLWEPAPARSGVPFPPTLTPRSESRFVGRTAELERLQAEAKEAFAGSRRVVLVAGEPGIGKTRLAAEVAHQLHAQGATVLLGRCEEELGAPYEPFVEILRHLVAHTNAHDLRDWVGRGGPELARLLPEFAELLPELDQPRTLDPETERLLLFEAIDSLLVGAAHAWPVLVVLDDLHWADKATLLLLRHLTRSPEPAALLVLGTYRESDLSTGHPLTETLADLRRDRVAERMVLIGLDEADTSELIASFRGQQHEPAFARTVRAETEGNPFFIEELCAHLGETEVSTPWGIEDLGVPDSVREVIGRRLVRLSGSTQRALTVASVIGREFDFELLNELSDTAEGELLDALEQAAAARLIGEASATPGRFAFSHALVRATLADSLSAARRVRLHRDIAAALESRYLSRHDEELLPPLAFHFGEAAGAGEGKKAAEYGLAAGRRALEQLDWDGATALLDRALAVLASHGPHDRALRCDVFMTMAETRLQSGELTGYRAAVERAAEDARAVRSAERVIKAAVISSQWGIITPSTPEMVALCEDALNLLNENDLATRAHLLAALASHRAGTGEKAAAQELSAQALDLARKSGDDLTLGIALINRIDSLVGSSRVTERLVLADEAVAVAERTGNFPLLRWGRFRRAVARLTLGDLAGFEALRRDLEHYGVEWRSSMALAVDSAYAALLLLLQGRFDDVEAQGESMLRYARDDVDFVNAYGAQLVQLRREQGRLHEVKALLVAAVDQTPYVAARAALALAHVDLGELEEARLEFDRLAADDFDGVPRDVVWTISLAILAEVCARLRDSERALGLYKLLTPHADHLVIGWTGIACLGAVDRYLGMLAATQEDWARAEAHYDAALALELKIDSRPLAARTRTWYARMLVARNERGDHERARELLGTALATAESLGMAGLVAECQAMLDLWSV